MIRPAKIAFLAGLLPVIAAHLAYLLNIFTAVDLAAGYICFPYFGGTALAQLLLVWVLWPVRRGLASGRLRQHIAWLITLVSLQWGLGVFSAFKRLIFHDPELIDRIENVIEWCYALPMSGVFIVIAWMFSRTGFHAHFQLYG